MKSEEPMWGIAITFCDTEMNGFVTLGGVGWHEPEEWSRQWAVIPESPLGADDPAMLMADKIDDTNDLVGERFITAETAERLLRRPLAELITEGRTNTAFTLRQVFERHPELATQFTSACLAND